jgi:hypothetical protein
MHFHHYRRPVYAPWQVANLTLPHVVHMMQAATVAATFKPSVNGLAPHPQLQGLSLFVQFVPIYPVTLVRPESPSTFCVSTAECTGKRHLTES